MQLLSYFICTQDALSVAVTEAQLATSLSHISSTPKQTLYYIL